MSEVNTEGANEPAKDRKRGLDSRVYPHAHLRRSRRASRLDRMGLEWLRCLLLRGHHGRLPRLRTRQRVRTARAMSQLQEATRLRQVRRELDEAAAEANRLRESPAGRHASEGAD